MSITLELSQTQVEESIDKFIETEMQRQNVPGVSLAVVRDGRPLIIKGYGFANLEHKIPIKPETITEVLRRKMMRS